MVCSVNYNIVKHKIMIVGGGGGCRHRIVYLLQLRPPFTSDGKTLKPKVGLRPNQT